MAKSNNWVALAPGVRACFRNGAIELEMFGVEHGIKQCNVDGVSLAKSYLSELPGETRMIMRNQFFENKHGVLVSLVFYADETAAQLKEREDSLLTEEDLEFYTLYDASKTDRVATARFELISAKIEKQQKPMKETNSSLDIVPHAFWDDEMVLAFWRGEKGPKTPEEAAAALRLYLEGKLDLDD